MIVSPLDFFTISCRVFLLCVLSMYFQIWFPLVPWRIFLFFGIDFQVLSLDAACRRIGWYILFLVWAKMGTRSIWEGSLSSTVQSSYFEFEVGNAQYTTPSFRLEYEPWCEKYEITWYHLEICLGSHFESKEVTNQPRIPSFRTDRIYNLQFIDGKPEDVRSGIPQLSHLWIFTVITGVESSLQ